MSSASAAMAIRKDMIGADLPCAVVQSNGAFNALRLCRMSPDGVNCASSARQGGAGGGWLAGVDMLVGADRRSACSDGEEVGMDRRGILAASALAAAAPALAAGGGAPDLVSEAVGRLAGLSAQTSCLIVANGPAGGWQAGHEPDRELFVGRAVKT